MAKYKCKILQRQSKDELIVGVKSLKTREPKSPKHPTLRELILSLTNRVANIERFNREVKEYMESHP